MEDDDVDAECERGGVVLSCCVSNVVPYDVVSNL